MHSAYILNSSNCRKELNERKGGGSSYGRGKAAQKSKDKSLAREDTVLLN